MAKKPNFYQKITNWNKLEIADKSVNKGYAYVNGAYLTRGSFDFLSSLTSFTNLASKEQQAKCYRINPVLNAVLNAKADAEANKEWFVKKIGDTEKVPLAEYDSDGGLLYELIENPNPIQSGTEMRKQFSLNYNVFGNAYQYASIPVGFESNYTYKDISVMNNLSPTCVEPKITGKYLEATTIDEIIEYYAFRDLSGRVKKLSPDFVFHMNEANIDFDRYFTEGVSKLIALQKPLSNIQLAYEARNIQIKRRGARGILSSDKKDEGIGTISLTPEEKEELQNEYQENYGGLEGQKDIIISPEPMRYIDMSRKTRDLMLFEEVESDAIAVCNAFGVPVDLVRYYIKTGGLTDENNANEKRLYDSTIIPKSKEIDRKYNTFLKLKDEGIELIGSYEHVKVLQANKKEEAETKSLNTKSALEAFSKGAIVYNEVLSCMGLPEDSIDGEKKVWDLDEKQLTAIGVLKNQNNAQDEEGSND